MPKIVIDREQLLVELEERRAWAQRLDAKNIHDHARKEQAALVGFKKRCREALKWTYEELRAHNFEVGVKYSTRPDCPEIVEEKLDRALAIVRLDNRKSLTLTEGGECYELFWLLTHDENAKVKAC